MQENKPSKATSDFSLLHEFYNLRQFIESDNFIK